MLNINRKVVDSFYRYKMPKLLIKKEGKGTIVLVNVKDVAKSLRRPPSYVTKFFGIEVGAQTRVDKKKDRYIVKGTHTAERLQELLDIFIQMYVLCAQCENPETEVVVDSTKKRIKLLCSACGHCGEVDTAHRLSNFIMSNPLHNSSTPYSDATNDNLVKKDKENENSVQSALCGWSESLQEETELGGGGDENGGADDILEDWCEDVTEDAVRKRMDELGARMKMLTFNNDLEKSTEQRFNIFFNFVKKKVDEEGASNIKGDEIAMEAERLNVKDIAVVALFELLFDQNILSQIQKHRELVFHFVDNNKKAQKRLLGALETAFDGSFPESVLPKCAHILKGFYDEDLVDEEVFLEWWSDVSEKYAPRQVSEKVHAVAKPFINWLMTAEEESSSDDGDDDKDDEIDIDQSGAIVLSEYTHSNKSRSIGSSDDNDDDFELDIDNI